jgi:cellobiose phosphorylase
MIAETRIGNGDKAIDYYHRINPSVREAISEVHRCEPYVYAQTIAGKESTTPGEAKNSWLTGTAAWNFVAMSQWILGVRPALNGLRIKPVIPNSWKEVQVTRLFRNVEYHIHMVRVGNGNELEILVDGNPVTSRTLAIPEPGVTRVNVEVKIGVAKI